MKGIKEVCKCVGVTRRTLQGYDEIGLLSPTVKTKSAWLYDDDAINSLKIIQIFIEAGYSRKEVKDLLKSSNHDIQNEINNAIKRLELQKKKITGLINVLKEINMENDYAPDVARLLSNIDYNAIYGKISFKSELNKWVNAFSDATQEDIEEAIALIPLVMSLFAIGILNYEDADNEKVKKSVKDYCKFVKNHIMVSNDDNENTRHIVTGYDDIIDVISEICEDETMQSIITEMCGNGAVEFISKAVGSYCNKQLQALNNKEK